MTDIAYLGADIHDGTRLHHGRALWLNDGVLRGIVDPYDLPEGCIRETLESGTILPGFVDLQVNGGGGLMFNDDQSRKALRRIADAHASLGTAAILPTLITDTPTRTSAAVEAVALAIAAGVPGIAGLHLEGPHLSSARKGAHDPALIRPMQDADLALILDAAARLPNLMVTVAPENTSDAQISAMAKAGVIVSLGHTDVSYERAMRAFDSGAHCTTHLFNAMSQLGSREPGLVGAALDAGQVSTGLIADGIHVHPAAIRAALAAKRGPGQVFLVSDAMAPLGTTDAQFTLNGRQVLRRDGSLRLPDGTLAGADLDMPQALRVLTQQVGVPLEQAIAMATSIPAGLLPQGGALGHLRIGELPRAIHLDSTLTSLRWIPGRD